MNRWKSIMVIVALTGSIGCQTIKRTNYSSFEAYASVSFTVDGLMKAKSGAT